MEIKKFISPQRLSTFLSKCKENFAPKEHTHTKSDIGLGNVENKSSAEIRKELTKTDVTAALGCITSDVDDDPKYLREDGIWDIPSKTTYVTGTDSYSGLTKLYGKTGTATDGTMTQAAISNALNSHNHDSLYLKLSGGTVTGPVLFNDSIKLATDVDDSFVNIYQDDDILYFSNKNENLVTLKNVIIDNTIDGGELSTAVSANNIYDGGDL